MGKRLNVFEKTNGRCAYCGCILDYNTFHIDHIIPKSKSQNNSSDINNLMPACQDCNLIKSNLNLEEFRKDIENMFFKVPKCRILSKYYNLKSKKIKFYFEQEGDENGKI